MHTQMINGLTLNQCLPTHAEGLTQTLLHTHTHTQAKDFTLLRAPHVGQKRPLKIYKRLAACEVFSGELSMTATALLRGAAMLETASALVFPAFVFLMYDTAYLNSMLTCACFSRAASFSRKHNVLNKKVYLSERMTQVMFIPLLGSC